MSRCQSMNPFSHMQPFTTIMRFVRGHLSSVILNFERGWLSLVMLSHAKTLAACFSSNDKLMVSIKPELFSINKRGWILNQASQFLKNQASQFITGFLKLQGFQVNDDRGKRNHRSGHCLRTEPKGIEALTKDNSVEEAFKKAGC